MITVADNIILFIVNPLGFLISIGFLIYIEYLIFKSIVNDPYTVYLKKSIYNIYHSLLYGDSHALLEQKIFSILEKKESVEVKKISHHAAIAISHRKASHKSLAYKVHHSRSR